MVCVQDPSMQANLLWMNWTDSLVTWHKIKLIFVIGKGSSNLLSRGDILSFVEMELYACSKQVISMLLIEDVSISWHSFEYV